MAEKFIIDSDTTVLVDTPTELSLKAIEELKVQGGLVSIFCYSTVEWLNYFEELQRISSNLINKTVPKELLELVIATVFGKRSLVLEAIPGTGDNRKFAFKVVSSSEKRHALLKQVFTDASKAIHKRNKDIKFVVTETCNAEDDKGVKVLSVFLAGVLNEEQRQGAIIFLTRLVKKGLGETPNAH